MSELRHDWLADRWVIFAPNRAARPDEFIRPSPFPIVARNPCPFCVGHESETPAPVLALNLDGSCSPNRGPSDPDWQVRVVPNRFPALDSKFPSSDCPCTREWKLDRATAYAGTIVETQPRGDGDRGTEFDRGAKKFSGWMAEEPEDRPIGSVEMSRDVFFRRQEAIGAHEVIVESPIHAASLTSISDAGVQLIFEAYRQRLLHWRSQPGLGYAVIFKNVGADAGASLLHSHSQLIATHFVPPEVRRCNQRLQSYFESHKSCYFCDMIQQESQVRSRVIAETDAFIALCPFASRMPFMIWILPKFHAGQMELSAPQQLNELAVLAKHMVCCIEDVCPQASYNYVIHTCPFKSESKSNSNNTYHWYMELFPRLVKIAGFEWGSECYINPTFPEIAAEKLRYSYESRCP